MPLWNIETSSAYECIYIVEDGKDDDDDEQNEKLHFQNWSSAFWQKTWLVILTKLLFIITAYQKTNLL